MRSNYKKLGNYIRQVNIKNTDGKVDMLVGVNLEKKFIPSVANIVGTDLTKYKVIKKGQFGCKLMSVGRDGKLPISLMKDYEKAIISSAYYVFEVKNENELLSDYLMMWLSRSENDRYLWFKSGADVRGSISWNDFCSIEINIPSIEKQREIVAEYYAITNRIKLNEQLNQKLEETAQAIYKEWFVDFEFPNENGKPYKSNGGEMVWCEELEKEIPKGWKHGTIKDLFELQRGFDLPTQNRVMGEYPVYASTGISDYHDEYKVEAPCVVTGRSGSLGEVFYVDENFWALNTTLWVKSFNNSTPLFAYFILKSINLSDFNGGSAVPTLNRNHLHMSDIYVPGMNVIETFELKAKTIFEHKKILKKEYSSLIRLKEILLSKMATVEG
ncbi:restriction endonuclease subunit S [Francisella philomiragia]|uniref:restriction endonuclease subunit S n=1 Tax=Francisella philomiragia TaxID=28110 RepID=UPI0019089FD2|nr:restriction endonuclease subunit S [Francisella philomiragia]MBK2093736.1 restriction endonuclease subunit S [Francisella philomiragia]